MSISLECLSEVLGFAPVGYVVVDNNTKLVIVNDSMFKLFNSTPKNYIGEKFGNVFNCSVVADGNEICGTLAECELCELRRGVVGVLSSKESITNAHLNHSFKINNAHEYKWLEVSAIPIIASEEEYVLISLVDITDSKKIEEYSKQNNERFKMLFENMTQGFALHEIILDDKGNPADYRFLDINQAFENLTGLKAYDLVGNTVLHIMPNTEKYWIETYGKVALTCEPCSYENYSCELGRYYNVSVFSPRKGQFAVIFNDVTQVKKAENALRESEYMLLQSQKVAHIGSYVNDVVNGTWSSSPELDNIFGIDETYPHTLEGWVNIVHQDWQAKLFEYVTKLYSEKTFFDMEYKIMRVNDEVERWVHGLGKLDFDENGNTIRMIGTIQDITERKLKDEEIIYRSSHDVLTGLYNRRKFEEVLDFAEESGEVPVSIIVGDVNSLKLINDAYGHNSGDTILKKIGEIIRETCGDNAYCARRGGDEFAIILPKTTYEEACAKVMQIKKRCYEESKDELVLTITFGVGIKIEKEQSLEKIQHLAEERMYTAKLLEGKNIRSTIVENLRMVLEEKTGETRNHCTRMSEMSQIIGEQMGFQAFEIANLKLLSLLHDIGKTGVPESILLKPGKLDEDEFLIMQKHCEIGYRIANTMPELIHIAEGVLSHHERWDGKGYPQGLVGANIPIMSRIVAVLDTYDAMINDRPYRKALSKQEAIDEIKRCSGTQFDPEIANVFLNNCI